MASWAAASNKGAQACNVTTTLALLKAYVDPSNPIKYDPLCWGSYIRYLSGKKSLHIVASEPHITSLIARLVLNPYGTP